MAASEIHANPCLLLLGHAPMWTNP